MRTRWVLLGELVIDTEPPIELRAELASTEAGKKAAVLKDRLAYLLDTRFRPADPEPLKLPASPSRTWPNRFIAAAER